MSSIFPAPSVDWIFLFKRPDNYRDRGGPSIYREPAIELICGNRYRAFPFIFPEFIKDNKHHSIYAYAQNLDGSNKILLNGAPMQHNFSPRQYRVIGAQPNFNSTNINTIVTSAIPSVTGFFIAPFCYGSSSAEIGLTWDVSAYTGFNPPNPRSDWQRGKVNIPNSGNAIQAFGNTIGLYVNNSGAYSDPACGGLAMVQTNYQWYLDLYPTVTRVWPSSSQMDKSNELIISYQLIVPIATGTSYIGPSIRFVDDNNVAIYYNLRAFDTRQNESVQGNYGSCTESSCESPFFYTTQGLSGYYLSYGRTVAGDFFTLPSMELHSFEFRINAYQLENAIQSVGCSNSNNQMLSCEGSHYRFSIVSLGLKT